MAVLINGAIPYYVTLYSGFFDGYVAPRTRHPVHAPPPPVHAPRVYAPAYTPPIHGPSVQVTPLPPPPLPITPLRSHQIPRILLFRLIDRLSKGFGSASEL